jgi:predicted peptidase
LLNFVRIGIGLAATLAVGACATRDDWRLAAGQHAYEFHRTVTERISGRMLLFLPADYDSHAAKKYPLLIFLHGSGEAGEDLGKVKVHGPPKMVESATDFPFIVASPQIADEFVGFDAVTLNAMLDELIARLPIDLDRIYVTGLSLGGKWAYGWASANPERFAAIAPMDGEWNPAAGCRLRRVPVWAFHGATDDVVPLAADQAMIDAINGCHGDARITVYPDQGHGAWVPAYADPALYTWLLAHRRSTNPN